MSAIGTKRTSASALQMSAFDPKRTCAFQCPRLCRYDLVSSVSGAYNEAAVFGTGRLRHASEASKAA